MGCTSHNHKRIHKLHHISSGVQRMCFFLVLLVCIVFSLTGVIFFSFQPACSSRTIPSWMGHPSSATPSWLGCPTASSILRLGRPASPDAIGPHPAPGSSRASGLDDPERLGATFLPPCSPPCSCSPSILRRPHLLLHSLWTCSFTVCFSIYSSISSFIIFRC